jgi:ribonuclease HI
LFQNVSNSNENFDVSSVSWGSTLYIASFIDWKTTAQGLKRGLCTYGYNLYKNQGIKEKVSIHRDFFFGGEVESPYEAEMKALLEGISHVPPEERLTIRTMQPSIANGINRDLEFWVNHNWHTKTGTLVKCQQEWQQFYNLAQGRKIVALCTQEDEFVLLQAGCKDLLQFMS